MLSPDLMPLWQAVPPAEPPTRTTDRTAMTGAPLWRLVDFADSTPDHTAAAIEAALEGSGLLDAWVGPRGEVEGHDIFAEPGTIPLVQGRSLADVLVEERDAGVEPELVGRLLSSIAYGDELPEDAVVALGADGAWRMGPLSGSWEKAHASFVGTLVRQRRVDELTGSVAEFDATLSTLDGELATLRARREIVGTERAARPDTVCPPTVRH